MVHQPRRDRAPLDILPGTPEAVAADRSLIGAVSAERQVSAGRPTTLGYALLGLLARESLTGYGMTRVRAGRMTPMGSVLTPPTSVHPLQSPRVSVGT